jgi:hypothetical protein
MGDESGPKVFVRVKQRYYLSLGITIALLAVAVSTVAANGNWQSNAMAIVVACVCAVYAAYNIWEIRDPTPGLVIDSEGIVVNMGASSYGRIPWNDISGFRIVDVFGRRLIAVDVVDQEKYIQNKQSQTSKMARDLVGSPVDCEAETIGLTADELLRVLTVSRETYRRPTADVKSPKQD